MRPISLSLYKIYRLAKKEIQKINLPFKQKILYPFTTRYFIHVIIIILSILVTTNSLKAREVKLEEFGQQTLFSELVMPDINRDTVEGIETISPNQEYREEKGFLEARVVLNNDRTVEGTTEIATLEGGSALVKATLPDTTATGTPREKVEFYQVQGGDTISTIASKFGISTNTILWANSLNSTSLIKPGQNLTVPPVSGILYKIKSGDTVDSIAKKYEADEGKILEFNQLVDASAIEVGQEIMVPGGYIEPPKPKPTTYASAYGGTPPASAVTTAGGKLQWPTSGRRISQYYRWGHMAIDISGNYSSPIYAAESGTVTRVGWGRGYGNVITINHGGGRQTLYAHLSKFYVQTGQQVSRGQTIGMMGCTGWCTGTHIHFEYIINGSKVNPLSYL